MERAYNRYKAMQEEVNKDPEYLFLQAQRLKQEPEFIRVLASLPQSEAEIIRSYLGICGEIGQRETELACWLP